MVHQNFKKLPPEKRELILQVSREEFVKKGYHGASTDIITQRAGISMGALFHYFKSKRDYFCTWLNRPGICLKRKLC